MEVSGVLRDEACWVSDQGDIWHGVNPEDWSRMHRRRQANRAWLRQEKARCICAIMSLRRASVPVVLAQEIMAWSFAERTVKGVMR